MPKAWGFTVDSTRHRLVQSSGLYPQPQQRRFTHVGKNSCLHTVFTRLSIAVSHSHFCVFTVVIAIVSPTFHSTYKDNYKVNILLSN